MKKNIALIAVVFSALLLGCDTKKVDQNIATEINDLKDSLKIKPENDTVFVAENQLNATALQKQLKATDGQFLTLDSILQNNKGKTVVIDIWASWCPDCIKGFGAVKELQESFPNVAYVTISLDKTEQEWKKALDKYELNGEHYYLNEKMKGEFGQAINLDWIPRFMIIDKKGRVANYKSIVTTETLFVKTLKYLENN